MYFRLDNFRKLVQNVSNKQEEWFYLLSADTPERILKAATMSEEMYQVILEVSQFVRNVEEVMDVVSEALVMMDRNAGKSPFDAIAGNIQGRDL